MHGRFAEGSWKVHLGAHVALAAHVSDDVGEGEREGRRDEQQPVEAQPEEGADAEKEPNEEEVSRKGL